MSEFELVTLKSGLHSLRSKANRETFHPVTGPKLEANILHVTQQRLRERSYEGPLTIWDVGFGAGANVTAAIEALQNTPHPVEIHSFDQTLAPIRFALENEQALNYLTPHRKNIETLLKDGVVKLEPDLTWKLHLGDFGEFLKQKSTAVPHAILYDPYSPVGNPEMWTLGHFSALRSHLKESNPCLLSNYTRSTSMRVTLLMAGFYVGHGCEVGEKAETTVASNTPLLILRPLTREWLKRVKESRNGAPMRGPLYHQSPISDEDFEKLTSHPQFLAQFMA